MLLFGLCAIWIIAVALTFFGVTPLAPATGIHEGIPAVVSAISLLAAWFWARPRVPHRPPTMRVDDYWRDGRVGAAAAYLLFLFEGGATIAASWVLVSGSWLNAAVSLVGIVAIAVHGPERLERPYEE
jgi:hypothetical protein